MQKNMNVTVSEGDAFFCHELSINFNPLQFMFDFKSVTPRVDIRSKDQPSIAIKHNLVMMDPYHCKKMHTLLSKVIKDYEAQFGKIKKPKAIEIMEKNAKDHQKNQQKNGPETIQAPSYFG